MKKVKIALIISALFLNACIIPSIVIPDLPPETPPASVEPQIISPTPFQPQPATATVEGGLAWVDSTETLTTTPTPSASATSSASPSPSATLTQTGEPSQVSTASPSSTHVPPTFTETHTASPLPSFTSTSPPPPSNTSTFTPLPYPLATNTSDICSPPYNGGYEAQVILLINNERAANGLSALSAQSQLTNAARAHSVDMACNDFFSHTGSNGSTMTSRVEAQGYSYSTLAENVAAGYGSPADVVAGWMSSLGHRANILNPSYTQIGIGYAYYSGSNYGVYWTANFGAP